MPFFLTGPEAIPSRPIATFGVAVGREASGRGRLAEGFASVVAWSTVASSPNALLSERLTPRVGFLLSDSAEFLTGDVKAGTTVGDDEDPSAGGVGGFRRLGSFRPLAGG